jgi:hypothetical protein
VPGIAGKNKKNPARAGLKKQLLMPVKFFFINR